MGLGAILGVVKGFGWFLGVAKSHYDRCRVETSKAHECNKNARLVAIGSFS